MGSSGQKSGKKERHRGYDQLQRAIEGFDKPRADFGQMFSSLLRGENVGDIGDLVGAAPGEISNLLTQMSGVLSGETDMPFGLNAPGILEGLIGRSQESVASNARAAGQGLADLIPTRGGGAERALTDVYRGAAGEGANIETGLRARAAEQELSDRLGMAQGLAGGAGAYAGTAGSMAGTGLNILGHDLGIQDRLTALRGGFANQFFKEAATKREERASGYGQIGSGTGDLFGSIISALTPGGGGGAKKGGGK